MGSVRWTWMHVSSMCVSYTCISCSCYIFLMIDYGFSMVSMLNLMLILWDAFIMSI